MFDRFRKWMGRFRLSLDIVESHLGQKVPRLNISLSLFLLGFAILTYTVVFSYFTILRHYYFQSSGWDLGIYMQSLYTTGFHGELLGYTLEKFALNPSGSFLGVHFSPFLFLLVPIYRVAPFAETLLILQSFVLAMGAFGLYLISYRVHENRFVSLALAISYLLYTPLQTLNWFDFHLQAFIPVLFFMMFYFYLKKDYLKSFVFLILVMSTIEMMPVLVFPFGFYCLLDDHKSRKALVFAISVICTSITWFLLASFVKASLNPMYSTTFSAWSTWGNGYLQILMNMVAKPVDVLLYFFTVFPTEKALYFLWFMAPLFFLPLLARKEFVLLVMPWIASVFLSAYPGYFTYQYSAFVAPQVLIATIYGLEWVSRSTRNGVIKKSLVMRYGKWVLGGTIITFLLVSPFGIVPQAKELYVHGLPNDSPHKEALKQALQLIPDNASVYTSFHIAPHLANRLELYAHAIPDKPPDYIIIDLKSLDSSISGGTFGEAPIVGMDQLLKEYNYSLIMSNDGILIYRVGISATPILEPITMSFNYKDLLVSFGSIITDSSSQSGSILTHGPNDWPYGFWHGPYVALPQGRYEVTCRVRSDEVFEGHMLTLDVTSESGQTLLARKYVYGHDLVPNKWNYVKLQFSIEQPRLFVEVRGNYASNMTTQYLDFIELRQYSSATNISFGSFSFNYQDFPLMHGRLVGRDLVVHEMNDSDPFSFGLYTKTQLGKYTARLWLKIDAMSQGHVFSMSADAFNKTNLAQMEIYAENFSQREGWQCFSLNFAVDNSTSIVEIRGTGDEGAVISFSYLELENYG